MAVTISNFKRVNAGNSMRVVGTITGPASYTTNGEALTATQIRQLTGGVSAASCSTILAFDSEVEPAAFRNLVLDRTNNKIKFVAGATEVTAATNLSAVAINFEAVTTVANG